MNTANNQRRQDTDQRIRQALLMLMEQQRKPTISLICHLAQINRSTFYRHYLDLADLLEKAEAEIQKGLIDILTQSRNGGPDPLLHMVRYVGQYRHFYQIYFRTNQSPCLETVFSALWDSRIQSRFLAAGITDPQRMLYYFDFVRAGITQVLRRWIDAGCPESPEEITQILRAVMTSSYVNLPTDSAAGTI